MGESAHMDPTDLATQGAWAQIQYKDVILPV